MSSSHRRDFEPTPRRRNTTDSPASQHPEPATRRRTRAVVACRLCRNRKTRCDNKRPSCGYCTLNGMKCVYPDDPPALAEQQEVQVTNKDIFDKISSAVEILEVLQSRDPASEPAARSRPAQESAFADDGFGHLAVPDAAARNSSCEAILRWPIFNSIGYRSTITSLGLEMATLDAPVANTRQGVVPPQDGIPGLCQRFLTLIHIKNPILGVSEFTRHARHIAEYGPGWDERSCLVLLACALACVAVPYDPELDMADPSYVTQGEDRAAAEAYYGAAQRRMGLLQPSLVAVQCQYLAGLYSKFLMRPLAAWNLLQSSCNQLQAPLYAGGLVAGEAEGAHNMSRSRHIEQRLYWSCVKAESELRIELQLPSAGRIKYPDPFPSLSFPVTSEINAIDGAVHAGSPAQALTPWSPAAWQCSPQGGDAPLTSGSGLHPEEERSWLYYLAEISLRSLMNRVLAGLYTHEKSNNGAGLALKQAQYIEELEQWHAALPAQLSFRIPTHADLSLGGIARPTNELSFFLQTRYLGVLEWIYRPALDAVLNGDSGAVGNSELIGPASQAIDCAAAMVMIVSTHHRHGGVWGLARRMFGAALVLIAVAIHSRNSKQQLLLPLTRGFEVYGGLAITTIQRWNADGGGDMQAMVRTLRQLMDMALSEQGEAHI